MSLRCCLRSRGRGEARAWLGDRRQRTKKRARGLRQRPSRQAGMTILVCMLRGMGAGTRPGADRLIEGNRSLWPLDGGGGVWQPWKPPKSMPKKGSIDMGRGAGLGLGDGRPHHYVLHAPHTLSHTYHHTPTPTCHTARQCTGDLTTPVQGRGLRSRTLLRGRPRRAPPGAGGSRTPRATSSTRCCRPSTRGGFAF